jgi:hypothetical protein
MGVVDAMILLIAVFSIANTLNIPGFQETGGKRNDEKCIFDAECRTGHFCKTHLPNPFGDCVEGKGENEFCLKNSVCASNDCSFFKCTKRIVQKDGACKKSVIFFLL